MTHFSLRSCMETDAEVDWKLISACGRPVQYSMWWQFDCGTLGIVLFKLEWDGRYRTVLAVKCNRQNRIPWNENVSTSLFLICARNQQCIKYVDWQNCGAKSRCNDDDWLINHLIILYFWNDSQRGRCYSPTVTRTYDTFRPTPAPIERYLASRYRQFTMPNPVSLPAAAATVAAASMFTLYALTEVAERVIWR